MNLLQTSLLRLRSAQALLKWRGFKCISKHNSREIDNFAISNVESLVEEANFETNHNIDTVRLSRSFSNRMPKQLSTYLILLFLLSLVNCKDSSDFKLCGLGICKPYYFTDLSYQGGLYQVEKEIQYHYTPVNGGNNNGVLRVSYKVNCEGDIGDVTYETYNLDFVKADLNPSLTEQLVNAVGNLSAWNPGTNDSGKAVNSHGFLVFKIVNGEITEILPK